jgi:urease alpha subunit
MSWNRDIASITSTAAEIISMGHCVGHIRPGYDADVVVWDSHPLALGATPTKVLVDGILQLHNAHVLDKPKSFRELPRVPDFDRKWRMQSSARI